MNTSHIDTFETSPAVRLGQYIRIARQSKGLTIAQLAEQVGRPREWLNRIELGHSEFGEHRPPSMADLQSLGSCLKGSLNLPIEHLLELGKQAETEFNAYKSNRRKKTPSKGKLTQAEIIIGEEAVVKSIIDLIEEQHSDAVIRNIGIRGQGSYTQRTSAWNQYRVQLGKFLANNPNGIFRRVEYVANNAYLAMSKETDRHLAYEKPLTEVHNARVKFRKGNPLSLHVLIGQREAILALPRSSGQPGSNMALLVRDRLFVEALRLWYDEVLWEGPEPSVMVDYTRFDESFEEVKKMYGYTD
jgi:transcriptional regulator with XRE-family HTH domain